MNQFDEWVQKQFGPSLTGIGLGYAVVPALVGWALGYPKVGAVVGLGLAARAAVRA